MKCKSCGAELELKNDMLICNYCKSTYFKNDFLKQQANNDFMIKGGVLTSYNGNDEIVIIPEGVVEIGDCSLQNNKTIKKVIFSNSVKAIGKNAFFGCVNLLEICNYNSVETFDDECFNNTGLKEITIGNNVKRIGNNSFANNLNLKTLNYYPKKNLKLYGAFFRCANLEYINLDRFYFFPSVHKKLEVKNNPSNDRPTFGDAFAFTPIIKQMVAEYKTKIKKGICPECNGKIRRGFFHKKCKVCGIDYVN